MSVTLNVGYNRKVGEPNYGSRGASVNLQIEKEPMLLDDAKQVQEQIEELFGLARAAVEAELARPTDSPDLRPAAANQPSTSSRITPNQLRAIRSLTQNKHIDTDALLQHHGGATSLEQLTRQQASRLISELNSRPGAA